MTVNPLYRTQRHCYKTVTVGGVTIPKGADAMIPIGVIHHMPQYWPDPYKFDPERQARFINPWLACAARVKLLGMCVCLSV